MRQGRHSVVELHVASNVSNTESIEGAVQGRCVKRMSEQRMIVSKEKMRRKFLKAEEVRREPGGTKGKKSRERNEG